MVFHQTKERRRLSCLCLFLLLSSPLPFHFCRPPPLSSSFSTTKGFKMQYLRRERKRWGLLEKVEVHHVIPRQLRSHEALLEHGYEVEEGYNLMFLPAKEGVLKTRRPTGEGIRRTIYIYILPPTP